MEAKCDRKMHNFILRQVEREFGHTIPKVHNLFKNSIWSKYLKIIEKVPFNIASEASTVYILSRQKLIKNAKNGQFWRVIENLKLAVKQLYQTVQF